MGVEHFQCRRQEPNILQAVIHQIIYDLQQLEFSNQDPNYRRQDWARETNNCMQIGYRPLVDRKQCLAVKTDSTMIHTTIIPSPSNLSPNFMTHYPTEDKKSEKMFWLVTGRRHWLRPLCAASERPRFGWKYLCLSVAFGLGYCFVCCVPVFVSAPWLQHNNTTWMLWKLRTHDHTILVLPGPTDPHSVLLSRVENCHVYKVSGGKCLAWQFTWFNRWQRLWVHRCKSNKNHETLGWRFSKCRRSGKRWQSKVQREQIVIVLANSSKSWGDCRLSRCIWSQLYPSD